MKNKEREKLIKKLCAIQLKHDKKLETIYNVFKNNTNDESSIFRSVDGIFIYEMFSIGLIEIVLDLMGMPCDGSSFCRDHYYDVWADCVEQSLSANNDYKIVEMYINIINKELEELLVVKPLSSFEKN